VGGGQGLSTETKASGDFWDGKEIQVKNDDT